MNTRMLIAMIFAGAAGAGLVSVSTRVSTAPDVAPPVRLVDRANTNEGTSQSPQAQPAAVVTPMPRAPKRATKAPNQRREERREQRAAQRLEGREEALAGIRDRLGEVSASLGLHEEEVDQLNDLLATTSEQLKGLREQRPSSAAERDELRGQISAIKTQRAETMRGILGDERFGEFGEAMGFERMAQSKRPAPKERRSKRSKKRRRRAQQ